MVTGTTSLSVPYPAGVVSGDLIVLAVGNKYPNNGPATPAGWTLIANAQGTGGTGGTGNDNGDVYSTVFVREATGVLTGNVTVTLTGANTSMGRMFRYTRSGGLDWAYAATNGSQNSATTSWSVTGAADPGIDAGDWVVVVSTVNGNRVTNWGSETVTATGATFAAGAERQDSGSGTGNDMSLVVSDHRVTAGTATAAPAFTMSAITGTANVNGPAGASVFLRIREANTTTLGTGTDPAAATIAPGAGATDVDNFTFQTNAGTAAITSITVNLSTSNGIGVLAITNNAGTVLGSISAPSIVAGLNVIPVAGLTATTTLTTFKVRVTPLSHVLMPAPPGAAYAITAPVTNWAGPNGHAGSDTNTNALTIDNDSPVGATAATAITSGGKTTLDWTTSVSGDFATTSGSVIYRWAAISPGAEVPAEGTTPAVGAANGTATVACVVSSSASTPLNQIDGTGATPGVCTTAALGGPNYTYKVFQKDTRGNYDTGVIMGNGVTSLGCTLSSVGGDVLVTCTGNGTFKPPAGVTSLRYLVVAGGGGGGGNTGGSGAGGGGAGGLLSGTGFAVTPGVTYPVTVGSAGSGGVGGSSQGGNGGDSTFSTLTAVGGGGGASQGISNNGSAGGSGGGGRRNAGNGGAGTPGQGNAGGDGSNGGAGGGGGAGSVGGNPAGDIGGDGGIGVSDDITGIAVYYSGGGGGGGDNGSAGGTGGAGGGATAPPSGDGAAGTPNTGGGGSGTGGSAGNTTGGSGGSGVVYLRYTSGGVAPGDFNAFETSTTPASAIIGQIYTKLVSTNFSLDVVAISGGAKLTTFSNTVAVDLVTGSTGGLNCPGGAVSAIAGTSQNVNLASGRGTTAAFNVASAFSDVRVRVRYPVVSPTVTSCSTDNFSIRPQSFTVTSTNANNTGTGAGTTIKTGANFNLTATAVAGYNGTPAIDNTKVVGTPTAGTIGGNFSAAPIGTGIASGNFYYNEVGNIGLNADAVRDTAFTSVDQSGDCVASSTSNTLSAGQYGCSIGSAAVPQTTGSSGFGRFIPDNFNVTYTTPPIFGTGCGTFTHVGAKFTYPTAVMTVTARSGTNNGLTNTPTANYAGAYLKLTNGSLAQVPYDTQAGRYSRFDALGGGNTPALDTSGLPATAGDPAIGIFAGGSGTLTFGPGTGLAFTRSTTTPNAPFNADIALALNVIDTDGIVFAGNPAAFGAATATNGIAFSTSKDMRYGRLRLGAASGSTLLPLRVPLEAQYWNGTFFITNVSDSCTTLATTDIGLGNKIGAGSTSVTAVSSLAAGRGTITLAAPTGFVSSVDVAVNLGSGPNADACPAFTPATATAAGKSYLRGSWCNPPGTYTKDPSARARFGIQRGSDETIYLRENY